LQPWLFGTAVIQIHDRAVAPSSVLRINARRRRRLFRNRFFRFRQLLPPQSRASGFPGQTSHPRPEEIPPIVTPRPSELPVVQPVSVLDSCLVEGSDHDGGEHVQEEEDEREREEQGEHNRPDPIRSQDRCHVELSVEHRNEGPSGPRVRGEIQRRCAVEDFRKKHEAEKIRHEDPRERGHYGKCTRHRFPEDVQPSVYAEERYTSVTQA